MNNPYSSQHPQQFSEGHNERWGSDENRGTQTWRDGNSNRAQGQQQGGFEGGYDSPQSGQQGAYDQSRTGQRGNYGQSRYSPNFSSNYSGQGDDYGQRWQGSNYDDYGYHSNEFADQHRGQWGQEYSPYSGQSESEYNPRRQQFSRGDNQRWSQGQSRDWQQTWPGRSQAYGNQFGFGGGRSEFGSAHAGFGNNQSGFGNEFNWGDSQGYGQGNHTYGSHYAGTQKYGSDRSYGRDFQPSSAGHASAAFGLQQPTQQQTHRGKGPKGYQRTDERIREEICELLSDDFQIDASEISVEVKDGIVTLEGTVQDRAQKHRIEDIADNCSGVKDVHNSLRVVRQAGQSGTGEMTQEKSAIKSH